MKNEYMGEMEKSFYGFTKEGIPIDQYILVNSNGLMMKVITYGGAITELWVPDKNGNFQDIVLGFDTLGEYESPDNPFFGSIIGRYGNRIAYGSFYIDGIKYQLAINDRGKHHLHGGVKGFHRVVFKAVPIKTPYGPSLRLRYLSHDGEEGYPGNLEVTVTYTLTKSNELRIDYLATTDKPTIINLTNHSYFNLSGDATRDILDHELWIDADNFTEVDEYLIPTGKILPVKDTPLDFTKPKKIREGLPQGYDHNFVLNKKNGEMKLVATLKEKTSGRIMEVYTTEPGLQLYTGNYLNIRGKAGKFYSKHYGLCLETQHFPDSPNHENFPSTILRPGETYISTTIYKFSIED
ncbi:MAG: galactose-1-epimerase [Dictyoglomus sp. NZ13-RE01]|nr:MAG: galactose-1-epimerase [Dictyoglomus sp. NZ13-RE01]